MSSIKLNEYRSSKTVISGFSFYQTNITNPTNALRTNKLNNDFDASSFLEGKNKALEPLDYLHDTFDNEELTNSMSFISNSTYYNTNYSCFLYYLLNSNFESVDSLIYTS